jgi:PAS domain S-box-containing protein
MVEGEVRDHNGHWYKLRLRPYETSDHRVDGVLVALLDFDSVRKSMEQVRQMRNYAESIVETIRESLLVLDSEFVVQTANTIFFRTFKLKPEETLGRSFFEFASRQWDIPALRDLLDKLRRSNIYFDGHAVEKVFQEIGFRRTLISGRRIIKWGEEPDLFLLAIEDVTESERVEQELRQSESTVRALLDLATQGIVAVRPNGSILLANPAMEKMFGYEAGELADLKFDSVISTEGTGKRATLQKPSSSASRNGATAESPDMEGHRKDESRFPVEISLSHTRRPRARLRWHLLPTSRSVSGPKASYGSTQPSCKPSAIARTP